MNDNPKPISDAELIGMMQQNQKALREQIATLEAELVRMAAQRDAILQQARAWAGEAKTQRSTVLEVGEILGGIPDWGPISAGVEAMAAENAKLRAELERRAPDGWKLVPVEPTSEMVSAAEEAHMPFGDMDIAIRMAILAAPYASGTDAAPDGLHIGAWRDALQKIAKYAPPVNHAARTEIERVGLIAVHALIAFSAPQFTQPSAHQEARNAAAPCAPKADDPVKVQMLEALEHARIFIRNGIDLGCIRMPDADTPDPAHETLPMIEAAIAAARQESGKV